MPILPQSEGFAAKNGVNAKISFFKPQRKAEKIYKQRVKEEKRKREKDKLDIPFYYFAFITLTL